MKTTLVRNIQILVTVIAVILVAIFSLSPLFSIKQIDNDEFDKKLLSTVDWAYQAEAKNGEDLDSKELLEKYIELGECISNPDCGVYETNPIDFVITIPNTVKVFIAFKNVMNYENAVEDLLNLDASENPDNAMETVAACKAKLDEIDYSAFSVNSIKQFEVVAAGIMGQVLDSDFSEMDVVSLIPYLVIAIMKLAFLIMLLVFFPISMVFALFRVLGTLFSRNPELKLGKAMINGGRTFGWIGCILGMLLLWDAELTSKGRLVVIAAGVAILVNIVASRFKNYSRAEMRYLNCMQITSAIMLVGIILFAVNITKADLVNFWLSSKTTSLLPAEDFESAKTTISYLVAVLTILLPFVYTGIISVLSRIGCMATNHKKLKKAKKNKSGSGIFLALLILALNVFMLSKFKIELDADRNAAFNLACIGCALALVGRVASTILRFTVLAGVTHSMAMAVAAGNPRGPVGEEADEDDDDDEDEYEE